MKNAGLLFMFFTIFLCGCSQQNPYGNNQTAIPSIKILSPSNNQTFTTAGSSVDIAISVQVSNLTLVEPTSNQVGQGHINYWIDNNSQASSLTGYTYTNAPLGTHVLKAELVNNDNTSFSPAISDSVTVLVNNSTSPPVAQPDIFAIEADDYGFYPGGQINVKLGDLVEVNFTVRSTNVYHGGLDIRSSKFNTGTILPGNSQEINFTADANFTFTSYWPSSGLVKSNGQVVAS